MNEFINHLKKALKSRVAENNLRTLRSEDGSKIDFTSNDYLGLARSEELFNRVSERLEKLNLKKNGATGSRLLSGNSSYTEEVEHKLAGVFKSEAALIFNSGYSANLSVLSSIPQRGDTIIYDELAHACIKDGARLSLANRFSFRHNDLQDLEQKIKQSKGSIFIAVESIYSMDGDVCPLQELVALAEKYDCQVIVDEAHSTGVLGTNGSGMVTSLGLENKIAIRVYTFGKAMGCHGACVAGSKTLIDYLVNFARPFIYTTALSPHSIASIDCAFEYLSKNIHVQADLKKVISHFIALTKNSLSTLPSTSSIQAILTPGNENAKRIAGQLQQTGFDVRPILSPTIPEGSERLRICLHVYNTESEIKNLTDGLRKLH